MHGMKPDPGRTKIVSDLLESLEAEYKEASDTWRALETKAQGVVGIAGVFLAAVFAFVREVDPASDPLWLRVGILLAALALVGAIGCAILALRIRRRPAPPLGRHLQNDFKRLLAVEDPKELEQRLENFASDQATRWARVNLALGTANEDKGRRLVVGQGLLGVAAGVVAVLVVVYLF